MNDKPAKKGYSMGEETDRVFQEAEKECKGKSGSTIFNKQNDTSIRKQNSSFEREIKTLGQYWSRAKEIYRERAERGEPELPTGIRWIDELTDGLHRGEVWCVSGRPGTGKTTLATNFGRNIADKHKSVLFISLEMTGEQLISRIFCEMMDFPHNDLRIGDFGKNFDTKDNVFIDFINSVDFEIIENAYRFSDIIEIIEKEYSSKKPDLIILDFVQLIDKEGQDDRLALDEFMRKIAELAKTQNIAILIVSQLRRMPSGSDINRPPDMTDQRGSGMIEQMSQVCVIIYKVIEKALGIESEKIMIKIAKNRNGECGEKEMEFKGNNFKFSEMGYKEALYADN